MVSWGLFLKIALVGEERVVYRRGQTNSTPLDDRPIRRIHGKEDEENKGFKEEGI